MLAPDPLHVCIALGPLAMYLLVLGSINLSSRPLLTTGSRDAAALAVAISGLVVAGPMELFTIEGAAVFWGGWMWVILLAAYALAALLVILLMRLRLVVYNITLDELQPIVAEVATQLDPEARWAGESLNMPQRGVQLHLEALPAMKNVQLVALSSNQDIPAWRILESELRNALRKVHTAPNPAGVCWIAFGLLTAAGITWYLADDPAAATQALNEMLRR